MNLDERKAAGQRAKVLRDNKELTQTELATLAGLDQSSISDFERGKVAEPSYEFVVKLAHGLRASPEFIFYGREVDFDTETLEFAYAFQVLPKEKRARWTSQLLMMAEGVGDAEVKLKFLKGKLPPAAVPSRKRSRRKIT